MVVQLLDHIPSGCQIGGLVEIPVLASWQSLICIRVYGANTKGPCLGICLISACACFILSFPFDYLFFRKFVWRHNLTWVISTSLFSTLQITLISVSITTVDRLCCRWSFRSNVHALFFSRLASLFSVTFHHIPPYMMTLRMRLDPDQTLIDFIDKPLSSLHG